MPDDHVRNENTGDVSGFSLQARDVHGPVTVHPRAASADELLAENVAGAVREQSRKEEDQWRIGDPAPLSVRWHSAERDLFDRWDNIQATTGPELAEPVPLSGQFTAIRDTFRATGSQRLLVLGRAGAGKTVLAHHLILDMLDHRDPRGPVPVLFSLNDWNPTTTGLREWLTNRLVRDHPFLARRDTTGKRSADLLVDRDWILPVLDGFDELPQQLRTTAISEISRVQWPLVVTSRPAEYARAAREGKAIGRAAAIELEDLTLEQAEQYLRRSSNRSRAAEWEAVFEHLRSAPGEATSRNLTPVLTTPLMIMLARTAYNEANGLSPHELRDTTRFATSTDLEQHLLSHYVGTVYSPSHTTPSGVAPPSWKPDQALRWLGHLASRLHDHNTHDFAWWQLPTLLEPTATHRRTITRGAALGVVTGLVMGLVHGTGSGPALGLVDGLMFGLASWLLFCAYQPLRALTRKQARRESERVRPHRRRRGRQRPRFTRALRTKVSFQLAIWLLGGALAGTATGFGIAPGFVGTGFAGAGFGAWPVVGLVLGLGSGLVSVVVSALGESNDPHGSNPWELLTTDRTLTLVRMSAASSIVMLLVGCLGIVAGSAEGLVSVLETGVRLLVFSGGMELILSAWGKWLLITRLSLPLRRRLPWRPKRFLEGAHARGVLRQTGAVYQFRHAQLRDHLADRHRSRQKTHTPASATSPR